MRQPISHPSGRAGPVPGPISESAVRRLHAALDRLRDKLGEPAVAPGDLVEPLLDLWAAADRVHPWVALPVQHFLTGLAADRAVAPSELASLADDVSLLMLEVRSLAAHHPSGGSATVP